jgi:hypothetical protein
MIFSAHSSWTGRKELEIDASGLPVIGVGIVLMGCRITCWNGWAMRSVGRSLGDVPAEAVPLFSVGSNPIAKPGRQI